MFGKFLVFKDEFGDSVIPRFQYSRMHFLGSGVHLHFKFMTFTPSFYRNPEFL